MISGIFFVFGTLALLGLSFLSDKNEEYNNKLLGCIILWSLASVFIHSFNLSLSTSFAAKFINYCLMSEGFIFILCGTLLFYLVTTYKRNFNIVYPILAVNILNLIFAVTQKLGIHLIWASSPSISGMMGQGTQLALFSALSIPILLHYKKILALIPIACLAMYFSFTSIFALVIVGSAYFIYRKRFKLLSLLLVLSSVFIGFYHDIIFNKLLIRLDIWGKDLKEVFASPFIGFGFDNSLNFNMIMTKIGMAYRHNDYLNIARDLGLPFLALIILGLYKILKCAKKDYLFWSILIILISCCVQTNMYFARIAGVAIVLLALKEQECLSR